MLTKGDLKISIVSFFLSTQKVFRYFEGCQPEFWIICRKFILKQLECLKTLHVDWENLMEKTAILTIPLTF